MRDMAVLQLFFSDYLSTSDLVKLAKDQVRLYQERIDVYRDIERRNVGHGGRERRMAPLHLGVGMAQVCLDFWKDIAVNPPPPERIKKR